MKKDIENMSYPIILFIVPDQRTNMSSIHQTGLVNQAADQPGAKKE